MRSKIIFTAGLWSCLVFFIPVSSGAEEFSSPLTPKVRVLVAENKKTMSVTVSGAYQIRLLPSLQVAKKGEGLKAVPLIFAPGGVKLGGEGWVCQGVAIEPAEDRDLYLDHSRFRGSVRVLKDKSGFFYAINTVDIESYLYGVLHHEVASWWPMEALKAQAIASRTYALYQAAMSRAGEYDLKSGTGSQVYGGSTTERYRTKKAVDETAGEVLTWEGKIFPAYFHATCAGVTAGAAELWKIDLPPLSGGVKCSYCRISPHYDWQAKIPLSTIEEKLRQSGRSVGRILKIEIISQTPSHRVGSLRITGTSGEAVIAAKDFRVWVGGDKMRSTVFTVSVAEDMAAFRGKGWGHGVGLCQWGTLGQALLGHSHEEILKFYYPGSEIKKLE